MAFQQQAILTGEQKDRIALIAKQYQVAVDHNHYDVNKFTFDSDKVHFHVGAKYIRLDIGGSGAFMIDIESGLIYGIKGYGVVDKKKVSGNAWDTNFDGAHLLRTRFQKGRFTNNSDGSKAVPLDIA